MRSCQPALSRACELFSVRNRNRTSIRSPEPRLQLGTAAGTGSAAGRPRAQVLGSEPELAPLAVGLPHEARAAQPARQALRAGVDRHIVRTRRRRSSALAPMACQLGRVAGGASLSRVDEDRAAEVHASLAGFTGRVDEND